MARSKARKFADFTNYLSFNTATGRPSVEGIADTTDVTEAVTDLDTTKLEADHDMSLTLTGDVSGTTTFTDMGDATLVTTIADDSHNHTIANVDGLSAALSSAESSAISTANTYTDDKESAITTAYETYTGAAKASANAYTDTRESLITSAYRSYADTAESNAISTAATDATNKANTAEASANGYTDSRESAITTAYTSDIATAKSQAISTAATDASNKANAAEANANAYTDTQVSALVDSSPAALDTLNELAAALGDDANFASTVSSQIGTKLDASHDMSLTLSGDVSGSTTFTNMGNATLSVTVADDSHNHTIANIDGLQAALNGKVDDSQVLTNVPSGAVFTDTVYSHPSYAGDDINLDTGALTGATVISDLDFNVTTDTLGHVTDANATYSTRNLTAANVGALPITGGTVTGKLDNTVGVVSRSIDIATTGNRTIQALANDNTLGSYGDLHLQHYGGNLHAVHGGGIIYDNGSRVFSDRYHPNADKWTTARTLSLGSDASGSVSWDGSGNVTLNATINRIDGIDFRNGNSSNSIGADSVTSNGMGYTSTGLLGQPDGALYSQAYSSSWVHQIYGDYRTGNMAVRGRNNGTWQSWKTVWTSGNDGSGSGLDADLLDGQHASAFAPASHSHSYLPLSGGTLTGTMYGTTVDVSSSVKIGSEVVLQESTDRADLLQITSTTSSWGGIQIRNSSNEGRWSFMTNGATGGFYDDENDDWAIQMLENSEVRLYHNGSEKLNTLSSGVYVTGSLTASSNVTAYSDSRIKENLKVIPEALDKVSKLTGYTYDRTDVELRQTGLIAQDVLEVLPEAVTVPEDSEEMLSLNYGSMVGLLVEAIKELKAEVEELKGGK